jgi:phosphotriesterase-related protein
MNAHTVLGEVPPQQLGVTSCHEHLLIDATCLFYEPSEPSKRSSLGGPVTIEILGELRRDPYLSRDNLQMLDVELAAKEAAYFKGAGGGTIVDCTTIGLSRDVKALATISKATGLNIISGTGFYVDQSHPKWVKEKTADALADLMVQELTQGVEGTDGIKCGVIGEIGTGWPITTNEEKVLRAAAYAQQKTGAPLNVHPQSFEKHSHKLLDILEDSGAKLEKVVLSHIDEAGYDPDYASSLAKRGCYVEFDTFGLEVYFDTWGAHDPSDYERVAGICELVRRGHVKNVLLGQDVYLKICLRKYGGFGFDHLLTHIVPMFRRSGLDENEINTMLVENPKRLLAF